MMHHWPYMTTGKTGRHGKARHVTVRCLRIFIYCYIFGSACLFWNKQATNILKPIKILLLMVPFHNGTLKFCELGLRGDRHWLVE